MAKEDVGPLPERVPRKKNQIEKVADIHIAMWLASDEITAKERKLLESEKKRRKLLTPDKVVCIITHQAGASREQLNKLREILSRHEPITEVRASRSLRLALRTKYEIVPDLKEAMKDSTLVLATSNVNRVLPSTTDEFWATVGYAKHRKIPTTVVGPDGNVLS